MVNQNFDCIGLYWKILLGLEGVSPFFRPFKRIGILKRESVGEGAIIPDDYAVDMSLRLVLLLSLCFVLLRM